jgi:hypothetical protein
VNCLLGLSQRLALRTVCIDSTTQYRQHMRRKGRGWNAEEIAEAGMTEDGELLPQELVSEETFDAWREEGKKLVREAAGNQWAIGQWIVDGEELKDMAGMMGVDQRFKNSIYKAAADITGHSVKTIKDLAFVVRHTQELRDEFKELSFAHFKLVASPKIDLEKKRELLADMQRGERNVKDSRDMVRFRTEPPVEKRSRTDNRAQRIIAHCDHVLEELDNFYLDKASPVLQDKVLRKAERTRRVLEFIVEGTGVKELV